MREATTGGTAAARQVSVDDAALLRKLGYQQELKRGLRPFENVAMGFAAISPVVAYITGGTFRIDGGQTIHGYPQWHCTDYRQPGQDIWTVPRVVDP